MNPPQAVLPALIGLHGNGHQPMRLSMHPALRRPARRERSVPDRDVLVTACGRICLHRKKVNVSTVLAGQRLGIKEVDEGIWNVSFMRYDLGFIDLVQRTS